MSSSASLFYACVEREEVIMENSFFVLYVFALHNEKLAIPPFFIKNNHTSATATEDSADGNARIFKNSFK
jgi:hypothetical protein